MSSHRWAAAWREAVIKKLGAVAPPWLPAAAIFVFGVTGTAAGVLHHALTAAACAGLAATVGFYSSISDAIKGKLLRQKIEFAVAKAIENDPTINTAAAFTGQSELATTGYPELKRKLERDYPVLCDPRPRGPSPAPPAARPGGLGARRSPL